MGKDKLISNRVLAIHKSIEKTSDADDVQNCQESPIIAFDEAVVVE